MVEDKSVVMYAVRHGETKWNVAGKQQGHLDSRLTRMGYRQADALGRGLVDKGIELMYSSDLGRAKQTAEIIGDHLELDIHYDARLRERHLGMMQGMTMAEFGSVYPEEMAAFESGDPDYVIPEGESAGQRFERCVGCAEELAARHGGQTILIVGHGGVLNSFFYQALNLSLAEPRRFALFNGAISRFTITSGRWRLDTWGGICHLGELDTLDDF